MTHKLGVLILILMEYSLRPCYEGSKEPIVYVLILILMEYSLRLSKKRENGTIVATS